MIHYRCKECGYHLFVKIPDDGKPYFFRREPVCKQCNGVLLIVYTTEPNEKVYTENFGKETEA